MIDFQTIEDAITAWVADGSGLDPNASIVWGDQSAPRRDGPWIAMWIEDLQRVGQDWRTITLDPTDGIVKLRQYGARTLHLKLTCYGGGATGALRCAALLDGVILARTSPARDAALRTAGIAFQKIAEPVTSMPGIVAAQFEPRATCALQLAVGSTRVSATTNYIDAVEITALPAVTSHDTGTDETATLDQRAYLDCGTLGSHNLDTVYEWITPGPAGNGWKIGLGAAPALVAVILNTTIQIRNNPATTVGAVEDFVTANPALGIRVRTSGTRARTIQSPFDAFSGTLLHGGALAYVPGVDEFQP